MDQSAVDLHCNSHIMFVGLGDILLQIALKEVETELESVFSLFYRLCRLRSLFLLWRWTEELGISR